MSLTSSSEAISAMIASTARSRDLIAVRPSPHSACNTTAMITGLMPYSSPTACGIVPNRTYIQAIASTIAAAGRMKHAPATTNPANPARSCPM